jgi:uncharacterized membrane protein
MTLNPYEPPRTDNRLQNVAPRRPGKPSPWEINEVLTVGWDAVPQHWPVLVLGTLLAQILAGIPGWIPTIAVAMGAVSVRSSEYWTLHAICFPVGLVSGAFFRVGLMKIYIAAARGLDPDFADAFSGGSRLLPMLGTEILMMLGILLGTLLFIVPGVLLSLAWCLSGYYVVDAGLGPMGALRASWNATKGHRGSIFAYELLAALITLGSVFFLVVGIFVALPVISVGFAAIYVRLSGDTAPTTGTG